MAKKIKLYRITYLAQHYYLRAESVDEARNKVMRAEFAKTEDHCNNSRIGKENAFKKFRQTHESLVWAEEREILTKTWEKAKGRRRNDVSNDIVKEIDIITAAGDLSKRWNTQNCIKMYDDEMQIYLYFAMLDCLRFEKERLMLLPPESIIYQSAGYLTMERHLAEFPNCSFSRNQLDKMAEFARPPIWLFADNKYIGSTSIRNDWYVEFPDN